MKVPATNEFGGGLLRDPTGAIATTNFHYTLFFETKTNAWPEEGWGGQIWCVIARNLVVKAKMDNCYIDVTNKIFVDFSGSFSFFSLNPREGEVEVNTAVFKWSQPNSFKGKNPALQGVIAGEYKNPLLTVKHTVFEGKIVFGGKFGIITSYITSACTVTLLNISVKNVEVKQEWPQGSFGMLIGEIASKVQLNVDGYSVTCKIDIGNNARGLIVGWLQGADVTGTVQNCDFGGADIVGDYEHCIIGGGSSKNIAESGNKNCAKP